MRKQTWLDKLSDEQLQAAYHEWQQAKRDIKEPPTLTFDEWLAMERCIALTVGP